MTPDAGTSLVRLERLFSHAAGRRRLTALVGLIVLVLIFLLGLSVSNPEEAAAILYAIPVVLIAVALGTIPGAGAGLAAGLLFWIAASTHDGGVDGIQIAYRLAVLVFLGAATGAIARRLQESEQDAQRLLEHAHEGVWTVDAQGRTTYVNPKMAELLGTTVAEVLRTPPSRWLPEDDPTDDRLRQRLGGQAEQYEIPLRRLDGSSIWVSISAAPIRDSRRRVRGSLALVNDISDRRRAEEERLRSERLLAEAQQIAHLGSWEWDVAANAVRWSDELYRIFGVEPGSGDATYEEYLGWIHPDDRELVDGHVRGAFETGEGFAFRHRTSRPDGEIRVIDSTGDVTMEDGRVTRMAGTAHDVTNRVAAEEDAAAVREQLALQSELSRRAVELNDEVVQGLAVAGYLLSAGNSDDAQGALSSTLARAKQLVGDLMGHDPIEAGDLRRERPADAE